MIRSCKNTSLNHPNAILFILAGFIGTTIITGGFLTNSTVSADNASASDSANASVIVPMACTMTGTNTNSHNTEIVNGTYTADIGTTTLKAFCNDNNGFAIYAAGFTGDEVGGTNSNKLVGTAASGNATIITGTATSAGNPDVSNWAMKIATVSSPTPTYPITIDNSFNAYHSVPNTYTKVAHRDSSTDIGTNAEGATLTTTYAAYISKTQTADTYTGQVIYTLVHPASADAPIYLNPNADDISEVTYMQQFAIVGDENRQSIIDSMVPEQQYTIIDSRDNKNYTIAKFETLDNNEEIFDAIYDYLYSCYQSGNYVVSDCDSSIYSEMSNNWKAYIDSYDEVSDEFDESLHPMKKSIWMTKNLDLDIDSTRIYTNQDTDIGYNTATGTYGTASWTPIRSTYATTNVQTHEWCQGGTRNLQWGCENNNTPESYDPGDLYWNTVTSNYTDWNTYDNSCDYSMNTPSCNQTLNPISTYTSSTGTSQYHLGNYYNWAAALATNNSSIYGANSEDELVEQSICPAGWTLPRAGNGDDSFQDLWVEYGYNSNTSFNNINNLTGTPLYFFASGRFNGVLNEVGYSGSTWSAATIDSGGAGCALINVENYVIPSSNYPRSFGHSVRCIARPAASTISGSIGGTL